MRTPNRIPVKAEQFLINSIAMCWPKIQNKNIRFQLNVLAESLQEELDQKMGRRKKAKEKIEKEEENTENGDIRKFIALFRDRYAQETDMEYSTKLKPDEIGAIKSIIKKLREKNINPEDYLSWVFDVFYEDSYNREKFSPMIKLICGTFVSSRFFMSNREKFRKKQKQEDRANRRQVIRDHAKNLFRRTKDPEVQKMLESEYKGDITAGYLEIWLKQKEKELEGVSSNE